MCGRKLYSIEVLKNLILLEFYVSYMFYVSYTYQSFMYLICIICILCILYCMSSVFSHGKGNCCVNTNLLCQRTFFHYSIACSLIIHSINWSSLKQACQYFNIPQTFHTGFWHVMTISNLDSCMHSFELFMCMCCSTQYMTKDLMGKPFVVFTNFYNISVNVFHGKFPW